MATTYVPTYAQPALPSVLRGGALHLDRDLTLGTLATDSRGRPALSRGAQRFVSRLLRALLTDQGDWWGDPSYGSTLQVGAVQPPDVALAISSVALHEARGYRAGPLAPEERIASMTVGAIQPGPDPRTLSVAVTITTVAGTRVPVTLQF